MTAAASGLATPCGSTCGHCSDRRDGSGGRRSSTTLRRLRSRATAYSGPTWSTIFLTLLLATCAISKIVAADAQAAAENSGVGDGSCDAASAKGGEERPEVAVASTFVCRMYVAPASIPGAGLGMYSGVPLRQNELLPQAASSDVVLQMVDTFKHWRRHREWCMGQLESVSDGARIDPACRGFQSFDDEDFYPLHYYWESHNSGGHLHANLSMSFVTGVGALVNSHPGLNNVGIKPPKLPERDLDWDDDADDLDDAAFWSKFTEGEGKSEGGSGGGGGGARVGAGAGAGASTSFHSVQFYSTATLPAFSELFADYGRRWFLDRTGEIGYVPLPEQWRKAANLATKLERSGTLWESKHKLNETFFDGGVGQGLWDCVRDGVIHSERLMNALPPSWDDVLEVLRRDARKQALEKDPNVAATSRGLALKLLPDAVRTRQWLDENGRCTDNVEPRLSTIPEAGRGAFARRSFKEGEVVLSSPLIPIRRGRLRMYSEIEEGSGDGGGGEVASGGANSGGQSAARKKAEPRGWQLFRNYCMGHPRSSLLFYPYASGFNLVNHDHTNPNVMLRWGTDPLRYAPSSNSTVDSVLRGKEGKMIAEYVAIKEIGEGDEVTSDYGASWEGAWADHTRRWEAAETSGGNGAEPKAAELNRHRKIRTLDEQKMHPYPPGITLTCLIPPAILQVPSPAAERGERPWFPSQGLLDRRSDPKQGCEVLSRSAYRPDGEKYRVKVRVKGRGDKGGEGRQVVVSNVPREAIVFYDLPYRDDQFREGAFRRELGVPEGMFPERWMDMGSNDSLDWRKLNDSEAKGEVVRQSKLKHQN